MLENIKSQLISVYEMRSLLVNDLQRDHLARTDNFYPSTSLNSNFIYKYIRTTYLDTVSRLMPPGDKFLLLTSRLVTQLDGRILKLATYLRLKGIQLDRSFLCKTSVVADVWISRIRGSTPDAEALLRASMDVSDIVFGCQTIIEQIPEHASAFVEQELCPFVEDLLPKYLEVLPLGNDGLKENLNGCFNNMLSTLSQETFDKQAAEESLLALKGAISQK